MPGSKLNSVLCLILILNPFGTNAGLIDTFFHPVHGVVQAAKCMNLNKIDPLLPYGLLAHELLPRGEKLWALLNDTVKDSERNLDSRKMTQVIQEDEYRVENHTFKTDDDYFLTYYRIPCGKKFCQPKNRPPVLLQHGFFTDSACWIAVAKEDSLPYILADAGYDVWLGNARGTGPSRGHKYLSPSDPKYWDFEWEKMGTEDIPAAITYILQKTGYSQLYYIGHSMGTTMAFAGLSLKPEVSDKIKVFFALAPVAWLYKSTTALRLAAPLEEVFHTASLWFVVTLHFSFVAQTLRTPTLKCAAELYVFKWGLDSHVTMHLHRYYPAFSRLLGQFISSISFKTLRHFLQNAIRDKFRQFDYGPFDNENLYGNCIPPDYNVTAIRSKTVFFYGENDDFSRKEDVEKLISKYNKAFVIRHKMPLHKWNHLDFLIGKNAKTYVADEIIKYMKINPIE